MNEQIISANCDHHSWAEKRTGLNVPATPDDILSDAHLSNAKKRELWRLSPPIGTQLPIVQRYDAQTTRPSFTSMTYLRL